MIKYYYTIEEPNQPERDIQLTKVELMKMFHLEKCDIDAIHEQTTISKNETAISLSENFEQ